MRMEKKPKQTDYEIARYPIQNKGKGSTHLKHLISSNPKVKRCIYRNRTEVSRFVGKDQQPSIAEMYSKCKGDLKT